MDNKQLWDTLLGELELSLSKANFTTWFKNTYILDRSEDSVSISVPNGFTKEWLENKYNKLILHSLNNIDQKILKIQYIIGNPQVQENIIENKKIIKEYKKQEKEEKGSKLNNLNPKYTFESFIIGSNNELAQAACMAVTRNLGHIYNPLFIYGGVGLGKTHLLQATGNEILKNYPDKKINYTSSEVFTNELIFAIVNRKVEEFKNSYRKIDILIIDDIQFLAGKEKTQEEFFYTFNSLYNDNKQIILSSDRPPQAIPTLEERLKSRFQGGMIADIGYPDYETRVAILTSKALEKNFKLSEDVISFIASNIQSNIRELEGALNRVIVECQLRNLEPNIANTTNILTSLTNIQQSKIMSFDEILKAVSDFYNISINDLIQKNRKKEIVYPRQIAIYLIRNELKYSYPNIGSKLGGRDHTTIMYTCDKIKKEMENNENLRQEINIIREKLYK